MEGDLCSSLGKESQSGPGSCRADPMGREREVLRQGDSQLTHEQAVVCTQRLLSFVAHKHCGPQSGGRDICAISRNLRRRRGCTRWEPSLPKPTSAFTA